MQDGEVCHGERGWDKTAGGNIPSLFICLILSSPHSPKNETNHLRADRHSCSQYTLGYMHSVKWESQQTVISFSHQTCCILIHAAGHERLGLTFHHARIYVTLLRRHAAQTCERTSCRFGNKQQCGPWGASDSSNIVPVTAS